MDIRTALTQLELSETATEEEAVKTYKELIRIWHPDNFASKPDLLERATAKTKLLNEAWATLTNRDQPDSPRAPLRKSPTPPAWVAQVLVFFLALTLLGSLAGWAAAADLFNPALRLEKDLVERAHWANRHLPLVLDADTTLTAVFSGPGLKFTYVYQVVNYTKEQVGQSYFEGIHEGLKKSFRSALAKDRDLKFFYANNIVIDYSFKDKTGADILTLEVKPEDYKSF